MRQRPLACLALLVFLLLQLLPARLFYEPRQVEEKCQAQITGQVARQTDKKDKTQIELADCRVQHGQGRFETDRLLVYLGNSAHYPVGTHLSLSGTIFPIEEPVNPGQFNSRLYYEGKGISYTVYAQEAKALSRRPAPVREAACRLQRRLGSVYDRIFQEGDSGILKAMVLGEKSGMDPELKELYQKNGISHVLAISGLHVSLVGMGVYRVLRRLTGSFWLAGLPTALFLGFYGWMTGASVSALRAAVMCGLMILADCVGRTYDMLEAAGAAALLLMLENPLAARQSAFLLSFGAVTAIGLLSPLWKLYGGLPGPLGQSAGTGLSVLAVTFPLLLLFFSEYPLYSTILNLLVIPLMSVLMACGILCALTGLFCLPLARLFGIPCQLILLLYEKAGEGFLRLPGALLKMGAPALWKAAVYYVLLTGALLLLYREKRRGKYWRGKEPFRPSVRALSCSLGLLLAGTLLLCVRVHTGLQVAMLDVGQGDGIFLRAPSGVTFLVDGGSSDVREVGKYRILPFLKAEGVGTLDYVLISHMDQDHISGILELLEDAKKPGGIRIGCAALPGISKKDEAYLEVEALFRKANIPVRYLKRGDRLSDGTFSMTCLWPLETASADDRNELSMVLLAEYGEFEMLLTGDIGEKTERFLSEAGGLAPVEVLKAAHHGSRYSSSEAFLSRVRPALCLISCSAGNRYGHPGEETLDRLSQAGSRILVTRDTGAVRVWTNGKEVRVRGFRIP